jgi:hypothetical protein
MMKGNVEESKRWASNPEMVLRARTMMVVSLSKRSPDELVRVLMDWLEDDDLYVFCKRNLADSEMAWILR